MAYDRLIIRQMHVDDIPEVVKIERISFSTPWSENSFYDEIKADKAIARVAELSNAIAGYICVRCVFDECHLLNLAIHPHYRKQGIATILVDSIIQEVLGRGCKFFYLEVRASNYSARRFYEEFGFRRVGIRKNYYFYPIEDAVIMLLEL